MQQYSESTPVVQLLDNSYDLDIFNSKYANMRWSVVPDVLVTIDSKYEANLPGLAFDYFGNQDYWRAILAFNGLHDPLNDICVGAVIGLPSRSSLDTFMTASNNANKVTLKI